MGMFDTVTLDPQVKLPEGYEFMQGREFQTKSFERFGLEYRVHSCGRMQVHVKFWDLKFDENGNFDGLYMKHDWGWKFVRIKNRTVGMCDFKRDGDWGAPDNPLIFLLLEYDNKGRLKSIRAVED